MKGKTVRTILTVLLAVMSVFVFSGCKPDNNINSEDNEDKIKIDYENRTVIRLDNRNFIGNEIIRTYEELKEFSAKYPLLDDETRYPISNDQKIIIEQYNQDFFKSKALIICCHLANNGRIKRQMNAVYVDENTLQIEVKEIVPNDGIANDDSAYMFHMVQVKQTDVINITDSTLTFKVIMAKNQEIQ